MKERFVSTGAFLCLAVLTCLLLMYALAIFPGIPGIRWFFKTSVAVLGRLDAPAWVQAVGSVVAIFASGGIAWWQLRATNASARVAARQKALVMVEAVGTLIRAHLNELESFSALLEYHDYLATRDRMERLDPNALFATTERAAQSIPLHDLPDGETIRLVVELQNHIRTNRSVAARLKAYYGDGESDWVMTSFPLGPNIEAARGLVEKYTLALKRVSRIA